MKSIATTSETSNELTTVSAWSPKICPAMPVTKMIGANTDTVVTVGTTYYYRLEALEADGSSEFHGPISAVISPPARFLKAA